MMAPLVSAYCPCYNDAATISRALESIRRQTLSIEQIFVVDDSSEKETVQVLKDLKVPLVRMPQNLGRGAVRARAMQEARYEFVLSCDATNMIESTFLERALPWFEDPQVAAVFGRLGQHTAKNAVERWRGRHLFKTGLPCAVTHYVLLSTYGVLVRRSAVEAVGGFDRGRRHSEDADLGHRLLENGYDVIFDPRLSVTSIARNTLSQVLERYWRWNAGKDAQMTFRDYLRAVWFSIHVSAVADLTHGDVGSAFISLLAPHYRLWHCWGRRWVSNPANLRHEEDVLV